MIQVYRPENINYEMNGDATFDPISCDFSFTLNGTWELELRVALDSLKKYETIEEAGVISCTTPVGKKQLFRICQVERTEDDVVAIARPVFLDAAHEVFLMDVRPTRKTGQEALDILMDGTKYSGTTDIEITNTAYYIRKNLIEAIAGSEDNTFLNRWGGEIIYDNYNIDIATRQGSDNGVRVELGRNIESISEQIDMDDIATRLVPVAYNGRTLDGDSPWVDSGRLLAYPVIYTKIIEFNNYLLKSDLEDGEEEDEECTYFDTLADLQAAMVAACEEEFANGADLPSVTYEIDMVDLSARDEYRRYAILENVSLGDTVCCYHQRLGIETTARVIAITWDCIKEQITKLTLGDYKEDYMSRVSSVTTALQAVQTDIATEIAVIRSNYIRTSQLEAATAAIGYLKSTEIDATYAKIASLNVLAEIVGDLTANAITTEYLKANYATIIALNAAVVDIEALTAGVADINTVIFGSASGTVIQTEFSNAVIAQLGTAQIKSAMIESVSADKITAGTIYTNLVRIYGDESKLLSIVDNTIQISDGTVTRVQIGEDASGDYNMYIWDAAGNLMWNATGATEAGLNDGIIKDVAVAEGANISATKLNIESLFSVINDDDSYTLKSSKIYVDADNQTLDVAFLTMTTIVQVAQSAAEAAQETADANAQAITTITETVTSQGTEISTIQGQITSKIWESDITTAIAEINIGGRNLEEKTNQGTTGWTIGYSSGSYAIEAETWLNTNALKLTITVATSNWATLKRPTKVLRAKLRPNTYYTLSMDTTYPNLTFGGLRSGSGTHELIRSRTTTITETEYGYHFTCVFLTALETNANWEYTDQVIYFHSFKTLGEYYFANLKLEEGNIATAWTPAPEDVDAAIADVASSVTTISEKYSTLSQEIDSIVAEVGDVQSTLETKADGSTVTELTERVSSLEITSDSIVAEVGSIQTTLATSYSTTDEMNSAIELAANSITSTVAATYTTKADLESSEPLIVGTQTAATGSWTGIAPFSSLNDGQKILYWLPYAGSGNATLSLTLPDGTTTGAINCYYGGTTRLTTQYAAGNAIRLTYRESVSIAGSTATYTGWWADANYNTDTYDRTKYNGAVKAASAIVAKNIIVGDSSGYHHLKTGGSFDITYPILYASSAISSGSTGTNNYSVVPFTITTTQSITLTAYSSIYIQGTISGVMFTPVSTTPLTQTIPTEEDGYFYILLGTAYSTTAAYLLAEHPVFAYVDGAFQQTNSVASSAIVRVANAETSITQLSDEIELKVSTEDMETAIDEVNGQITTISDNYTSLSQTATSLEISVNELTTIVSGDDDTEGLVDDVNSLVSTLDKHFVFSENGLTIRDGTSDITLVLDNGVIYFQNNGTTFAYWSGDDNEFHTGDLVVDVNNKAQFGDFAFIPREDGSLSFLKIV